MDTTAHLSRLLQWLAWISGTVLLAFLLFMLIGHLTGNANGPNAMAFSSTTETMAFVFFPVCTIVGLALAYKWELLGGAVAVASLVALIALRPDLLRLSFLALAIPGVLYLLHWALTRYRMVRASASATRK